MNVPTPITVGPYTYTVVVRQPDVPEDQGMTNHPDGTITIRPLMSPDYTAETLLHECLHAVWHVSGIDDKINEEHVVSRLATHLLDFIRRNPDVVEYLAG